MRTQFILALMTLMSLQAFAADRESIDRQRTNCDIDVSRETGPLQSGRALNPNTDMDKMVFSAIAVGYSDKSSQSFQKTEIIYWNRMNSANMVETTIGDDALHETYFPGTPNVTEDQARKLRKLFSVTKAAHYGLKRVTHLKVTASLDREFVSQALIAAGLRPDRMAQLDIPYMIRLSAVNIDGSELEPSWIDSATIPFKDDANSRMKIRLGCTIQ